MPLELKPRKGGIFYVEGTITIWRNGRPVSQEIRKSTRTRNRYEADAIRRQIESAVAERNVTGREPALTFNAAADRYVTNGGEARFLTKPREALGRLRIDEITQEILDDEGVKAYGNTATRRRQFHGPVIAVLHSNGIRTQFDRPEDSQKRTYFLHPAQAVAVIGQTMDNEVRYLNPWTPAFVTFLFGQGSRVSETLAIDGRSDISLPDRYAILRNTKNGQERMVTLCSRVIAALSTIPNLGHPGPLFLRYDGRPYAPREDRGYYFSWWERAVKAIGLGPDIYTPHTARHSWATWFYSQTKDVVRLKAEGGWESDEWQRYVKLAVPQMGMNALEFGFNFTQNTEGTDFTDFLRKTQ